MITSRVELLSASPGTFPGLAAWWVARAAHAAGAGGAVSTWADRSGNGRDLVSSGTARPTYQAAGGPNGQPFLRFDGVNDFMTSDPAWTVGDVLAATTGQGTWFAVVRANGTGGPVLAQDVASGSDLAVASNLTGSNKDSGGQDVATKAGDVTDEWLVLLWRHDGTKVWAGAIRSGSTSYTLDDADLASATTGDTVSLTADLLLGKNNAGAFCQLDVAEAGCFSRALSEQECQLVGRALCAKYGLTYAGTAPALLTDRGFDDLTPDVVGDQVKATWGISGTGPTDRIADPGTMEFDLDNGDCGDGAAPGDHPAGFYSFGHPDCLPGFSIGTEVRLVLVDPLLGERVRWWGTVLDATPNAGLEDPRTTVQCVDWMEEAARAKVQGFQVQTNVQSDVLFSTLVASLEKQPPAGTRAGTGSDIYPYAFDNVQDESSRILGELQKLALSEIGLVYLTGGVLVFEGRKIRGGGSADVRWSFDEGNVTDAAVQYLRDDVYNRVQVSIHPRRVDAAATTVLFNLGSSLQVTRSTEVQLDCPYRDPNQQAQRVGGKDMVNPVATTDYTANTAADGSGTNITSQFSVTYVGTPGGNTATVTVRNNGPLDGYVTKLQLRGRGLYDFEPVLSDMTDADSVAAYGENVLGYDMPYQSNPQNALDTAAFVLTRNKDADLRASQVTFVGDWDDDSRMKAFYLDVSDRVSITLERAGLDAAEYYVNGVTLEVNRAGPTVLTLTVVRAATDQFWLLEVPGRSELDLTTKLGYGLFAAGWILGTSTLDDDTFLN